MSDPRFPPVDTLVPHSGDLVLLDRILTADQDSLSAALTVRADGLYNHGDRVPAWVGMEYMAQAIAAFAGWHAHREQRPVQLGFLLGSRRFSYTRPDFTVGESLVVTARKLLQDDGGMGVFECILDDQQGRRAEARLNVFQPKDSDQYLRDIHD